MNCFLPLALARFTAAIVAPIPDCDEVFNFWEPTHYLMHSVGFEPWEYSPQHALRSWLYIWIHRVLFAPLTLVGTKAVAFYGGRALLAVLSAFAEARLWDSVGNRMSKRVARLALFFSVISPGMFMAAPSILPTSFALLCLMVSHAAWISEERESVTLIIAAAAMAVVLGWPFAGLLMLPAALDVIHRYSFRFCLTRCWPGILILVLMTAVDTVMYGRPTCSLWNLVWFNFLGAAEGESSEIFGVEPWHFFAKNLALNFNLVLVLALLAPLLVVQRLLEPDPEEALRLEALRDLARQTSNTELGTTASPILRERRKRQSVTERRASRVSRVAEHPPPTHRWLLYMSPFFLWAAFWLFPPHKEERFMVPAYHLLILSAAVAVDGLLALADRMGRSAVMPLLLLALPTVLLSLARIAAQVSFYSAPLHTYAAIAAHQRAATLGRRGPPPAGKVCVGKEWYRFPSHFLLPPSLQAFFLPSHFGGLLPTHFPPIPDGPAVPHPELNRRNKAVWTLPSITTISQCQYVVDLDLPDQQEPHYADDTDTWEPVSVLPFLDAAHSPALTRWLYIPFLSRRANHYAPYIALHRRAQNTTAAH